MDTERASKLTRNGHFFRFWMPYLFQRIEVDGVKWAFLPLNRNYKPLGITSRAYVDYRDYAQSHGVKFSRDPAKLVGIWNTVSEDGSRIWLYEDDPHSRADYFDRLDRLMALSFPVLSLKAR